MHNDSGDRPRLFLVDENGHTASFDSVNLDEGLPLESVSHIDWEEISYRGDNILIADVGNNENLRKDLILYEIIEPSDLTQDITIKCKYPLLYTDQKWHWFAKKNYDCEAVFSYNANTYLITKHRSDRLCTIYRFDELHCDSENYAIPYCRADLGDMVTAADFNDDTKSLAVLTYQGIWVFDNFVGDDFFNGEVRWLPIQARQCEAICFGDSKTLIISNEQRDVFEVPVADLIALN